MLGLGIGYGVEPPHAHDFSNGVARSVIGVGVCAQHAAQVCLKPELVGRLALLAAFVDAEALHRSREWRVHTHVDAREGIVAAETKLAVRQTPTRRTQLPVCAFKCLGGGRGAELLVGQCVDVCGETRGRRGIYASNMVIYACLNAQKLVVGRAIVVRRRLTCFPPLLRGCLIRCTRSGGPSSRRETSESVRASIASWSTSSVNLGEDTSV